MPFITVAVEYQFLEIVTMLLLEKGEDVNVRVKVRAGNKKKRKQTYTYNTQHV
jgi:hypothetical protein